MPTQHAGYHESQAHGDPGLSRGLSAPSACNQALGTVDAVRRCLPCERLLQTQLCAVSADKEASCLRSCRSNELGKVPKAEPLSDFSAETRVPTASRTTSDGPNSGWELEPRQSQSSDSSLLDCRRRSGCGARKVWEEGEPGAAEADLAAQDTASR